MQKQFLPARAFSLFSVATLLFAGLPMLPFLADTAQAGAVLFQEEWDLPNTVWTYNPPTPTFAGQDCNPHDVTAVTPPCVLEVQAQTTGQTVTATASPTLNITGSGYEVGVDFYNQWTGGTDSSALTLRFPGGEWVQANLTYGAGNNNLRLITKSSATSLFTTPSHQTFGYTQQTWYRLVLKLDVIDGQVHGEVRDLTGHLLASSSSVGISANASHLNSLTFDNYYYGTDPLVGQPPHPVFYDDLQVTLPDPPQAPTLAALAGPGAGQIALNWSVPSDDGGMPILNYLLYRGNATGNETTLVANTTIQSFTDSGLGNGVKAYYVVKAVNAVGASPASNEASATTFNYPSPPQNLKAASGVNVGEIALTWNAPVSSGGTPVTNYTIYRGNTTGSEALLAQIGANRTYTDTHRPNGTAWFYTVTATNLVGEGTASAEANSTPKPDQAWAPTGVSIYPTTGWTGDPRTVNFTYQVAVSQCDPSQTCPVDHQWMVLEDGTPGGVDGAMLANGTNTHPGHAEIVTYSVSTTTHPTGADGTHLLQVAADPRVGSTQWNESSLSFHLDAPAPGYLIGPSTPQLNATTTTGNTQIQVLSNYSVFQKQCRPTDSCSIQNDWKILLDGTSANSPDGQLLDSGSNQHSAHGDLIAYTINRSVQVPPLTPGPHYLKVAARADANSSWQVSYTLLAGIIFAPNLDDATYDAGAGQTAYNVTNNGTSAIWAEGPEADLPTTGHSGSMAWGTTLAGNYPPLADGTFHFAVDLTGKASATLSFNTLFETADSYDAGQVWVQANGQRTLLTPSSGPAYAQLMDGSQGYAGSSGGWKAATFDLSPYAGGPIDVQFEFRSDALQQARGWFLDDLQVTADGSQVFSDSMENVWTKTGTWTLAVPTTGPQRGDSTLHAWSVAPFAPYPASSHSLLQLPTLDLSGVGQGSFSFEQWFHTEYGNDSAHVEISPDGGATWQVLRPATGLLYDRLPDGSLGWSGNSLGWRLTTFDLSPYAYRKVQLRFVFTSDDALQSEGWYVSDFLVTSLATGTSPLQPYNAYTTSADAFYAYFESSGKTANFTTPNGQTVSVKYTGNNGDVVARLAADGTLTARQALVVGGNPTPVSNTSFVVTNGVWVGQPTSGTWTIHGAPTLLGVGGTQLVVGGKTFDDVSPASEAIEGTGNGKVSAQNQPILHWNWHNQATARYDTGLTSTSNPEETTNDTRLRYEIDSDSDGFSDKAEIRGHSDPFNASSTPYTDDDADGVPNILEPTRTAALDPLSTALASYVQGPLTGVDWEHSSLRETTQLVNDGEQITDSNNDGVPDFADLTNDPAATAVLVGTDPAQNALAFSVAKTGMQIAILVPPDWKSTSLVEIGNGATSTTRSQISYAQFFSELSSYYATTGLSPTVQAQPGMFLDSVLRQHLNAGMTFNLVKTPATPGLQAGVPLDFLAGTGAEGTWTLIRDTDVTGVTLTLAGMSIDASLPQSSLPNMDALHVSWHFINMQNAPAVPNGHTPWYSDSGAQTQCLSYNAFLRDGSCAQFPTTQGMRLFGANASFAMRGLLTQLRTEYQAASLAPQVVAFVQAQAAATGLTNPAPSSASPAWYGAPQTTLSSTGVTFSIPQGTLAAADIGAPSPRAFDWSFEETPANSHVGNKPATRLVFEPSDHSTTGSTIVVYGATLRALGYASTYAPPSIDPSHAASTTIAWRDVDGDGINDYVLTFAHFSKAWAWFGSSSITPAPLTYATIAPNNPNNAFLSGGFNRAVVWDGMIWGPTVNCNGGSPGCLFPNDVDQNRAHDRAVASTGPSEAWYVGGNDCGQTPSVGWILRLAFNPANEGASSFTGDWQFSGSNPTTGCGTFYDVDSLTSTDVWAAGELGIYHYDGSSWTRVVNNGHGFNHTRCFDDSDCFVYDKQTSTLLKYDLAHNSLTTATNIPFVPAPYADSVVLNSNRTVLWAINGIKAAYCQLPCTSWTNANLPAGTDFIGVGIYGDSTREAWAVGSNASGNAAMYRYVSGTWTKWTAGIFASDNGFAGIGFQGNNEGWTDDFSGRTYHYTGSNSPPFANFTKDKTSATTIDVVNVDGSTSSDPDGDPITYSWNWGDNTAGVSTATASHRYTKSGTYQIQLTVTDTNGASTTSAPQAVTITDAALTNGVALTQSIAGAGESDYYQISLPSGADQLSVVLTGPSGTNYDLYAKLGSEPTTTSFDASSTGSTSSESIAKTPAGAGTWYIMVNAVQGSGQYTLTATLRSKPSAPTIAQGPNPQFPNQPTWLNGSATGGSTLTYTIAWGDSTTSPPLGPFASGTSYSAQHNYGAVGTYTATVTVTDQFGLSNSNTGNVNIRDVAVGSTDPSWGGLTSLTLNGTVSSMNGLSSVDTWFVYGQTTSYGSSTSHVTRSATGSFSVQVPGLATNTLFHYKLMMQNSMGTSDGGDRTVSTADNGAGAPTLSVSPSVTARSELVWANGSAVHPQGANLTYSIDWKDGTNTSTFPASGNVSSGTTFSLTHTYSSRGTYLVTATATDEYGVVAPTTQQAHDVVDFAAGTTSAANNVGRTSAVLNGNITDTGGDSAGVLAWFQYGTPGGATQNTTPVHYTGTTPIQVSQTATNMVQATQYQYRLIIKNERGTSTNSLGNVTTNSPPTWTSLETFPSASYEDTPVSFQGRYTDVDNDAPPAGYPAVVIDGIRHVMTPISPCVYTCGVVYAYNTTLDPGTHSYKYVYTDGTGPEQSTTQASVGPVYRIVAMSATIKYDSTANGLPSPEWTRVETGKSATSQGPFWHTVNTPNAPGLRDAPDWPTGINTEPSVSLWFGDNATGTYANGTNEAHGSVITPPMHLELAQNPALTFWTYFETQDNGTQNDTKKVYVIGPDGHETQVDTLSAPYHGNHQWWPVSISLRQWQNQTVRVRFEFATGDGQANNYRGWFINQLTVGTDRDNDGIPDSVERNTTVMTIWRSPDGTGIVPGNSQLISHQWGLQASFPESVYAAVKLSGTCNVRVVLNTTDWSTTLMNGTCSGFGTGTAGLSDGSSLVLLTNLVQAGFNAKKLDTPQTFTLTVTTLGSGSVNQYGYFLLASGHTQYMLGDSDGDGLTDGAALNVAGVDPLSRDPDNDGFLNAFDTRPFTSDAPPSIDVLGPKTTSGWPTSLQAHLTSRYGISDARLVFTGSSGNSRELVPSNQDGNTWQWDFPSDLGAVSSVRLEVNDSLRNNAEVILTYNAQQHPQTIQTSLREWSETGIVIATTFAGSVATISPTADAVCVAITEGWCALALVAGGIVTVGIGTIVAQTYQHTPQQGTTQVVRDVYNPYDPRYTRGIVQDFPFSDFNIAAGSLGCSSALRLLAGPAAGAYATSDANGIVAAYSSAFTTGGYNAISDVQSKLRTELQGTKYVFQLDAFTGVLMYVDYAGKFIDRWHLQLDPTSCDPARITYEDRTPTNDPASVDQIIQLLGAATMWALMLKIVDHGKIEPQSFVHILDGKSGNAEVTRFPMPELPQALNDAVVRSVCDYTIIPGKVCDWANNKLQQQYELTIAMLAMNAAQGNARPCAYAPPWYWEDPSNLSKRCNTVGSMAPVASNNLNTVTISSSNGAWNDLGALVVGSPLDTDQVLNVPKELKSAEDTIKAWNAGHPATRSAYLPMVAVQNSVVEVYIELEPLAITFGC